MSSWIDKYAIETTLKLKNEFNINCFIETGTFYGVGAELYSKYFDDVFTCEINKNNYDIAHRRLVNYCNNISIVLDNSHNFLKIINNAYQNSKNKPFLFFFLDAHCKNDLWTVAKELQSLENLNNCIIAIHDFDCSGLGHLIYDNQHCNWGVIRDAIYKVNPKFEYYCNTRSFCDIYNKKTIYELPIHIDEYVLDMLNYSESLNEKKYRGILYAIPREIDLTNYKLIKFKHD